MRNRRLEAKIAELAREKTGKELTETENLKESGWDERGLVAADGVDRGTLRLFLRRRGFTGGQAVDAQGFIRIDGEIRDMKLWEYLKEKMAPYAERIAFAGSGDNVWKIALF